MEDEKPKKRHIEVLRSLRLFPSLITIMFVTCVGTGSCHVGSCGFTRDYLGDAIDNWAAAQ